MFWITHWEIIWCYIKTSWFCIGWMNFIFWNKFMVDIFIQSSFTMLTILWMVVSLILNTHFIGILFCSSCSISSIWQIRVSATICSGVSSSRPECTTKSTQLVKSNGRSLYFHHWDVTFLQPDSNVIEILFFKNY